MEKNRQIMRGALQNLLFEGKEVFLTPPPHLPGKFNANPWFRVFYDLYSFTVTPQAGNQ